MILVDTDVMVDVMCPGSLHVNAMWRCESPGILGSACRVAKEPRDQAPHPANL
jgi:hypothetical protein